MFSFLSQLRLPSLGMRPQEEEDDTSSSGRSLNLPWPVTESATKKTPASTAAKREWMANHPIAPTTPNGINISYPIPRTANSLTGFDPEFPAPPSGLAYGEQVHVYGHSRPVRTGPQYSGAGQGAWYEQDKSNSQAPVPYAPPEVVRLDSIARNPANDESKKNENEGVNPPPPRYAYKYNLHPSPSSYALPYPAPGGNSGNATAKANQVPPKVDQNEYDNESESEHEFYTSPFDPDPLDVFPAPPQTTTANAAMTKSRWNLKLQLHSSGAQSTPSLLVGAGTSQSNQRHTLPHFASQNPLQKQTLQSQKVSQNGDDRIQNHDASHYTLPVSVDTDVYNHAYNYPLAKQLSPIAEQDYISPVVDADSRSVSLKFGRGGDGNISKASLAAESTIGSVLARAGRKDKGSGDMAERESTKRSVSVGSVGNGVSLSRAGSTSRSLAGPTAGSQNASPVGSVGSEITRPSPIYASPFITRHLNRTVSQTSSKSDSQSQGQTPQAQTPAATPSQGQAPGPTRAVAQLSTALTSRSTSGNTLNGSANSNSNPYGREVVQTPISAGTTTTTPTGPMYTPTSTLLTPTAQTPTPTSPLTAGGAGGPPAIMPPAVAVTTNTLHAHPAHEGVSSSSYSTARLPKIPSLPSIPPLDLRFSLLGSVGPRVSREIRMERSAKTSATQRRSLGEVDKMPVIAGSVDGHYEEEDDEEEHEPDPADEDEEDEDEDEDEEEYDRDSLHAESFVTAGTNEDADIGRNGFSDPERGIELAILGKHNQAGLQSSTGLLHSRVPDASASNSVSSRSLPATTVDPGSGGIITAPRSATGDSFIHRRWDRDAALGFGDMSSSPTTFRAKGHNSRWPTRMFSTSFFSSSSSTTFTPAFWAFWLGFICPVLWLVGGWHFTNAGELPPKYTMWEWYFWSSRWSIEGFKEVLGRVFGCRCFAGRKATDTVDGKKVKRGSQESGQGDQAQRRKGKRRSSSQSKARAGKIFPALPRWVAEKQSTDDGRMRLNDPKRSLRGISFGYPFISRPPGSQDSCGAMNQSAAVTAATASSSSGLSRIRQHVFSILARPNRVLDLLYGVQLKEVRGRPESGRRMFDPWIQRCRYALCYGLLLLAAGLCTASAYLIAVNTKKLV